VSAPVATARSGAEYKASLADGRAVFVDGEQVDVRTHAAFTGIVESIASLFDVAADPAEHLMVSVPDFPGPVGRIYLTPRSREELADRRHAIERLAWESVGFIGRGPDHVAAFVAGFAAAPAMFAGKRPFGDNVVRFHRKMAIESLYCTYCIVPPSIDRVRVAEGGQPHQVALVAEDGDGIVVRGSQILGTGTAVSDWLFVSCMTPLQSGQERFALSFVVPLSTPGLRILCRRPYAPLAPSIWDAPLSARFDETDALVTFHDVFVPWENVFVCGDVGITRQQFHGTPAHILGNTQGQIRLAVKLKFILGLAVRITETMGALSSDAQDQLADLVTLAAHVEGMILAAEYRATIDAYGVAVPDPRFLYAAMALQAETYPRALHMLRLLTSSQLINLPSSYRAVISPMTGPELLAVSTTPKTRGEHRLKLFKLAWDTIGSEFAARHHQYEMFYAGAPAVAKNYACSRYRLDEAGDLVDRFLASYDLTRG
jgi:4-hydroxyphenylacetate 3-monooxygenase